MFRFHKQFLFETPEATPAAPVPVPAPPAGDAPWASDLAGIVPDEAVRGQVDGYLREKWQPRMTQFEQQLAESAPARELWGDFQSDPVNTFVSVASELFEDQPEILAQIQGVFSAEPSTPAEPTTPGAGLPPEQAAMLAEWQAEREAAESAAQYNAQVEALKAKHPEDTFIDAARIAPFVVSANGDIDAAYLGYQQFINDFRQATGASQEQAQQAAAGIVAPAPPAVLGSTEASGTGAPPPVAKRYTSIDDAFDDAMADMRAAREAPPATVGSV